MFALKVTSVFGENHIITLEKKKKNSSDEVDKFQALLFEKPPNYDT